MALTTTEQLNTFGLPGSVTKRVVGPVLASAGTIAITHPVHHVTGTTEIDTITPPGTDFCGCIYLIADTSGGFDLGDDGNIAIERLTIVQFSCVCLLYDPIVALWYPIGPIA